MSKRVFFIFMFLCVHLSAFAAKDNNLIFYPLTNEPIDVVIVTHPKDKVTIDLCIEGLQKNCNNLGRIFVVSSEPLTDKAEWFDEGNFPFNKTQVNFEIGKGDLKASKKFFTWSRPVGWYYQQLLKLYAAFVIPNISSNVLVIDSDTLLMRPIDFLNKQNGGLFCLSTLPAKKRYLRHAERLVPGYKRIYPEYYSVCHHMLFQKPILDDLFKTVEKYHKKPLWKAFCNVVDLKEGGASEYEIYYNFALNHTDQVDIRPLKWTNSSELNNREKFVSQGYHYVSFHEYMRRRVGAK